MRVLLPIVTLAVVAVAAPSQAQDFLRGLARAAGASAARTLMDRATSAASSAVSGDGGSAAPTTSAAPRQGGRPEMYNADGERIFRTTSAQTARFGDQPLWRSAAYCAALAQLVDIDIEEQKARHARGGHVYRQDWIDERLSAVPREVERWRVFGTMRMRIDHPSTGDGGFQPEVDRQLGLLRAGDWTPTGTWRARSEECSSLYLQTGSLQMDMHNGRGEGSRGAPR